MRPNAGQERREYPRKRVDIEVFLAYDEKPGKSHTVTVYDISLSGMAVHPGSLALKVGDKLFLCLADGMEGCGRDHVIEATVMHLHHGLVGMRFDSVGVSVLGDIHQLLRGGRIF